MSAVNDPHSVINGSSKPARHPFEATREHATAEELRNEVTDEDGERSLSSLACLSLTCREWHGVCVPYLWEEVDIGSPSCETLVTFIREILPLYMTHIRSLFLTTYNVSQLLPCTKRGQPLANQDRRRLLVLAGAEVLAQAYTGEGITTDADAKDASRCSLQLFKIEVEAVSKEQLVYLSSLLDASPNLPYFAVVFQGGGELVDEPSPSQEGMTAFLPSLSQHSGIRTLSVQNFPAPFLPSRALSAPLVNLELGTCEYDYLTFPQFISFFTPLSSSLSVLKVNRITLDHPHRANLPPFTLPALRELYLDEGSYEVLSSSVLDLPRLGTISFAIFSREWLMMLLPFLPSAPILRKVTCEADMVWVDNYQEEEVLERAEKVYAVCEKSGIDCDRPKVELEENRLRYIPLEYWWSDSD
ncbi:hypothetical protein JCM8547_001137 [Rhodosporidiobolus lusitaniae]